MLLRRSVPLLLRSTARTAAMKTPFTPNQYPAVQRSEHVETFQSALSGKGVEVPDPYVDLQDPLAPATKEFVRAQGAFAQAYLDQNDDAARFSAALAKNWDYARYSLPARKGDGNCEARNDRVPC